MGGRHMHTPLQVILRLCVITGDEESVQGRHARQRGEGSGHHVHMLLEVRQSGMLLAKSTCSSLPCATNIATTAMIIVIQMSYVD
jgi:hypothetical protein